MYTLNVGFQTCFGVCRLSCFNALSRRREDLGSFLFFLTCLLQFLFRHCLFRYVCVFFFLCFGRVVPGRRRSRSGIVMISKGAGLPNCVLGLLWSHLVRATAAGLGPPEGVHRDPQEAQTRNPQCKQQTAPHTQHFLACGSRHIRRSETVKELFVHHSRAPCLIRTRRCLNTIFHISLHFSQNIHIFHLSFYTLAVRTQFHRIHGQQDRLVVRPYRVRSQGMSPTPSLRSAVQKLLLFTMHQGKQVLAQHTPRLHRKWMSYKASGGWLSTLLMQKREASAFSPRVHHFERESSVSRASRTFQTRRKLLRYKQQAVTDFEKIRAEEAVQGKHEALSRLGSGIS